MDIIRGTISAKEFDVVFDQKNGVKLTSCVGSTTSKKLVDLHFVAFERIRVFATSANIRMNNETLRETKAYNSLLVVAQIFHRKQTSQKS